MKLFDYNFMECLTDGIMFYEVTIKRPIGTYSTNDYVDYLFVNLDNSTLTIGNDNLEKEEIVNFYLET
jgi:hypothetical protein